MRGGGARELAEWERGSDFDQYEGYGAEYYNGPYYGGGDYGGGFPGPGSVGEYGGRRERGPVAGGPMPHRHFAGRAPKGYRRSDERIYEEICELMTRHPELDPTDVEVKVGQGEVTLTGSVDNRDAKRLAEDIAEEVLGVTDVHNRLVIRREQAAERELFG